MNNISGLMFVVTLVAIGITAINAGPDCSCNVVGSIFDFNGCVIDPANPPPEGYKCNCQHFGVACRGKAVRCQRIHDYGCSGCSRRECCSAEGVLGDCNGYDHI